MHVTRNKDIPSKVPFNNSHIYEDNISTACQPSFVIVNKKKTVNENIEVKPVVSLGGKNVLGTMDETLTAQEAPPKSSCSMNQQLYNESVMTGHTHQNVFLRNTKSNVGEATSSSQTGKTATCIAGEYMLRYIKFKLFNHPLYMNIFFHISSLKRIIF